MNSNKKIEFLSVDSSFGVLTRPALVLELSSRTQHYEQNIYVIDLANIHRLNAEFGYLAVNARINKIFTNIKKLYPNVIIGRVFSGDEFAIINAEWEFDFLSNIIPCFKKENIGFKCNYETIHFGKSVAYYNKLIDELINSLNDCKYFHAL